MFKTLRLTTPHMHGPVVKRLQEFGDLLGFDYGENDGIFGPETHAMVIDLQFYLDLKVDGICGPKTWNAILKYIDIEHEESNAIISNPKIYDRRGLHDNPRLYGRMRRWSSITGITLHQTGCQMPTSAHGWDRLNAHIGITRDGKVILANDPTLMIWHAQHLSLSTIGIEIAGNYAGIDGDYNTVWRGGGGPDTLNSAMLIALDLVFNWLIDNFKINNKKIQAIYAHRQSARSRIGDPGSEIWQKIAIPWIKRLGISRQNSMRFGTGRRIPKDWDVASPYRYYEKPTEK